MDQSEEMKKFFDKKHRESNDAFKSAQKVAEGYGSLQSSRPLTGDEQRRLQNAQRTMREVIQHQDKDNRNLRNIQVNQWRKDIGQENVSKLMEKYYKKRQIQ